MRKRIPRYAGGQVHMSDVDRILLREFQTQGQVDQLRNITGEEFTGGDTFTAEEQEEFKDLYDRRLDRFYTRGRGQRADNIIARKFPDLSDEDRMLLINMYTPDRYVNPFDKPMMNYGGTSNKKLPKAQTNFFPYGMIYAPDKDKERADDAFDPKLLGQILDMPQKLQYRIAQYLNELYNVEEGKSFPNKEKVEKYVNSPFFKSLEQKKRGGAKKKDWIKGAIKNPGALTAAAKRAGAVKKDGTIKKSWLQQQAKKGNSKTARRARLALTLGQMKK